MKRKSQASFGTDRIFPFFEIEEALKKGLFYVRDLKIKKIYHISPKNQEKYVFYNFLQLFAITKYFLHKIIFEFISPESYNYIKKAVKKLQ